MAFDITNLKDPVEKATAIKDHLNAQLAKLYRAIGLQVEGASEQAEIVAWRAEQLEKILNTIQRATFEGKQSHLDRLENMSNNAIPTLRNAETFLSALAPKVSKVSETNFATLTELENTEPQILDTPPDEDEEIEMSGERIREFSEEEMQIMQIKNPLEKATKLKALLDQQFINLNIAIARGDSTALDQARFVETTIVRLDAALKNNLSDYEMAVVNKRSLGAYFSTKDFFESAQPLVTPELKAPNRDEKKESRILEAPFEEEKAPQKKSFKEKIKGFMSDVKESGLTSAVTTRLDDRNQKKLEAQWNKTPGDEFDKVLALFADYANVDKYGISQRLFSTKDWTKEHMKPVREILKKYEINLSSSSDDKMSPPERDVGLLLSELAEQVNQDGKGLNPHGRLNAIIKLVEEKCHIKPKEHEEFTMRKPRQ